jgi:hypothetical protein
MNKGIHIYFNKEYPHGYTTATRSHEAFEVCQMLVEATHKTWGVVSGSNHWKTGKPAYYIIWTDVD